MWGVIICLIWRDEGETTRGAPLLFKQQKQVLCGHPNSQALQIAISSSLVVLCCFLGWLVGWLEEGVYMLVAGKCMLLQLILIFQKTINTSQMPVLCMKKSPPTSTQISTSECIGVLLSSTCHDLIHFVLKKVCVNFTGNGFSKIKTLLRKRQPKQVCMDTVSAKKPSPTGVGSMEWTGSYMTKNRRPGSNY